MRISFPCRICIPPSTQIRERSRQSTVLHLTLKKAKSSVLSANPVPASPPWRTWCFTSSKPTSGKVFYEGRDTSTFKAKDLLGFRRHVQPVFQNPYGSLDPMYSIFRSIEEPLRIHKIGDSKWRANRVKELLDMVEMPASVMGRYPNELSGGQRQRIAIARAMALDPDVIVCDEAVSALDVLVQDQVLRLLNDLQAEKGLSYLFITHDLAVVRQIADEVVVMQHGKLVEHATTDEVFDHPQKQYTRDLLDAIPGGKLQLGLD